jgi:hypothetical protein
MMASVKSCGLDAYARSVGDRRAEAEPVLVDPRHGDRHVVRLAAGVPADPHLGRGRRGARPFEQPGLEDRVEQGAGGARLTARQDAERGLAVAHERVPVRDQDVLEVQVAAAEDVEDAEVAAELGVDALDLLLRAQVVAAGRDQRLVAVRRARQHRPWREAEDAVVA